MPRDRRGWRADPAPDGRGTPEEHKPRPPHRLPIFWVIVFLLFAINRGAVQPDGIETDLGTAIGQLRQNTEWTHLT